MVGAIIIIFICFCVIFFWLGPIYGSHKLEKEMRENDKARAAYTAKIKESRGETKK